MNAYVATYGPACGALVIAGGGNMSEIIQRFIGLAGGVDAPIVIVPTAEPDEEIQFYQHERGVAAFRSAGATNFSLLHTRDREIADSEDFVRPLQEASGVWFLGGRHWRLADAYLHTRTHRELNCILDRGGVIGGTSAGATIQGSFMVRGDTRGNEQMIGDHTEGFGFMRNVTIDQHLIRRNRQFDLIEVIETHPHLTGIGIDEETAIVVMGDTFEVIGRSCVAIYDHERLISPGGKFFFLSPGDTYNLKTRDMYRNSISSEDFERIRNETWPI